MMLIFCLYITCAPVKKITRFFEHYSIFFTILGLDSRDITALFLHAGSITIEMFISLSPEYFFFFYKKKR